MRIVIQRVIKASVSVNQKLHAEIGKGLLILVGIEGADAETDVDWLAAKIVNLRIFNDEMGIMNRSVQDINGEIMLISQFTLHASTRKGNRPSYIKAASPEKAIPLYEYFCLKTAELLKKPVKTGIFGADMQVTLINDGPVTILMDSQNKT